MQENKPIRAYREFTSNIKGLPVDGQQYMTMTGYSQSYPFVVVDQSPSGKTLTLKPVNTLPDPEWKEKMDYQPGGFAGHCANQSEQTWLYAGVGEGEVKVRLKKSRYCGSDKLWGGAQGEEFIANGAVYFYDYNF